MSGERETAATGDGGAEERERRLIDRALTFIEIEA